MELLEAAKNMVERLHGEAKAPTVDRAYQELRQAIAATEANVVPIDAPKKKGWGGMKPPAA
jgi:hypothetical protein